MTPASIRDERQDAILDAAQQIIAERGIDAVSMAELAAATGLSRPAIYQYFASREHVLAELVINEMADLSNAIDEHISNFQDPMERIRIWIHYTLAHLAEESRGMINAMHGHFMMALLSPVRELGVKDVTATCHLIYATVAAAAKRIDEGSEYVREAAALEQFTISGIAGAPRPGH
jgi:AcrR family transcriptional regulator